MPIYLQFITSAILLIIRFNYVKLIFKDAFKDILFLRYLYAFTKEYIKNLYSFKI